MRAFMYCVLRPCAVPQVLRLFYSLFFFVESYIVSFFCCFGRKHGTGRGANMALFWAKLWGRTSGGTNGRESTVNSLSFVAGSSWKGDACFSIVSEPGTETLIYRGLEP
jgi:hypothetical protein